MSDILFSITIPAFKKSFLKNCITSILNQSYRNFELIIVDDASPEQLHTIVDTFSDDRIKYFRNKTNCGAIDVVDNWNICLNFAQGDYVICMGDDDELAPDALEEYCKLIKKSPNVDLFHSRVKQIDENGNFIKLTDVRPEWESVLSMIWYRMLYRQQYIGDYLFKTKTLKDCGGFHKFLYAWASDDVTAYIVAAKNGCVHTNNPTFFYRVNSQTITQSGNSEIKMRALMDADAWYEKFISEYTPSCEIDNYLKIMIQKNLKKYSFQQKSKIISNDLLKSIFNMIKWVRIRRKYKISTSLLGYAFFEFLKIKNR